MGTIGALLLFPVTVSFKRTRRGLKEDGLGVERPEALSGCRIEDCGVGVRSSIHLVQDLGTYRNNTVCGSG